MPLNKYKCLDCELEFLSFEQKCSKCLSENIQKIFPKSIYQKDNSNKISELTKYEIEMNKQKLRDMKKEKWGIKK